MHTLKQILPALEARGVSKVEITYEGSGDSGDMQDVTFFNADDEVAGGPADELKEFVPPLIQLGELLLYDLHPGYENNDGGFGTITIYVLYQKIEIDHNDRYMEVSTSSNQLKATDVQHDLDE